MPGTLKKTTNTDPSPLGARTGNGAGPLSSFVCDSTTAEGARHGQDLAAQRGAPFAAVAISGVKKVEGGRIRLNIGGTICDETGVQLSVRVQAMRGELGDSQIDRLGVMVRMGHIGRCAKVALGHGGFAGWVKEHNLRGRTLQRAMRLAKWFGNAIGELDINRCRTALKLPKTKYGSTRSISQRQLEALAAQWDGDGVGEVNVSDADRATVAAKRTVRVLDRLTLLSAELPPEVASEVDEKLAEIRELVEALAGGGK